VQSGNGPSVAASHRAACNKGMAGQAWRALLDAVLRGHGCPKNGGNNGDGLKPEGGETECYLIRRWRGSSAIPEPLGGSKSGYAPGCVPYPSASLGRI